MLVDAISWQWEQWFCGRFWSSSGHVHRKWRLLFRRTSFWDRYFVRWMILYIIQILVSIFCSSALVCWKTSISGNVRHQWLSTIILLIVPQEIEMLECLIFFTLEQQTDWSIVQVGLKGIYSSETATKAAIFFRSYSASLYARYNVQQMPKEHQSS